MVDTLRPGQVACGCRLILHSRIQAGLQIRGILLRCLEPSLHHQRIELRDHVVMRIAERRTRRIQTIQPIQVAGLRQSANGCRPKKAIHRCYVKVGCPFVMVQEDYTAQCTMMPLFPISGAIDGRVVRKGDDRGMPGVEQSDSVRLDRYICDVKQFRLSASSAIETSVLVAPFCASNNLALAPCRLSTYRSYRSPRYNRKLLSLDCRHSLLFLRALSPTLYSPAHGRPKWSR